MVSIDHGRRSQAPIGVAGVKSMKLFKITYPDIPVEHAHMPIRVVRYRLDNGHIAG